MSSEQTHESLMVDFVISPDVITPGGVGSAVPSSNRTWGSTVLGNVAQRAKEDLRARIYLLPGSILTNFPHKSCEILRIVYPRVLEDHVQHLRHNPANLNSLSNSEDFLHSIPFYR